MLRPGRQNCGPGHSIIMGPSKLSSKFLRVACYTVRLARMTLTCLPSRSYLGVGGESS